MSGALLAALAGVSNALGNLSANETTGAATDSVSYWVRGYVASTSNEFAESGAVGSMTSTALGPATVVGCYWRSNIGAASNGSVFVEVTGNRTAGAVNTLSIAGTGQGSVGAPTFNAGTNTTTFKFGPPKLNPFAGTQAIVIS